MSFLDQLKQQAGALQSQHRDDEAAFQRNAAATDAACRTVFQYGLELMQQLDVLRPPVPGRYGFDRQHGLDGPAQALRFADFRIDSRRKQERGLDLYDHVVLSAVVRDGRRLVLEKDMPDEMERLEGRLAQAGQIVQRESVREPDSGRFITARYEFDAEVRTSVRIVPVHADAKLLFTVTNFGRLETLGFEVDADRVETALLDELAKWWLGQPHAFRQSARLVRASEPR